MFRAPRPGRGAILASPTQEAVIEPILESAVPPRPFTGAAPLPHGRCAAAAPDALNTHGQRATAVELGERADRRAVARALGGDREAFGEVARRHAPGLVSLCGRLVGDARAGEELAQDALARAFARLDSFRGECSFRHWLYRIAVNGCRDQLRAGGRADEHAVLTGDEPWSASDPERDAGAREELAALGRALASLPAAYREAFTLFFVEDRSYDEIAAATGVRVNALKVRVHRARQMLRAILAGAR